MTGSGDRESFCREVEAYLCRKNDGHLVRIVGPAFDHVNNWSALGIPIQIVFRGIDRYFERYYARGPRRRPVRVEFCEADVLDVFDEWKRAVGVRASTTGGGDAPEGERTAGSRRASLTAHLERVVSRLTALRGGEDRELDETLEEVARELDAMRARSRTLRGEARQEVLARLRTLDTHLVHLVGERCDERTRRQIEIEAARQLEPFRARMPEGAYSQSRRACVERLLRERFRLPAIAFDHDVS